MYYSNLVIDLLSYDNLEDGNRWEEILNKLENFKLNHKI